MSLALALPVLANAQSSAPTPWSTEQVAGQYSCHALDPDAGVYDIGTGLSSLSYAWPKKLALSSDGTWQAFNSSGQFRIVLNEIQLKSANWAAGVFAAVVRDKQSTTAIAVYFPGWCANDPDVQLATVCIKAGEKVDEGMLINSFPDPHKFAYFSDFPLLR